MDTLSFHNCFKTTYQEIRPILKAIKTTNLRYSLLQINFSQKDLLGKAKLEDILKKEERMDKLNSTHPGLKDIFYYLDTGFRCYTKTD